MLAVTAQTLFESGQDLRRKATRRRFPLAVEVWDVSGLEKCEF